MFRDLRRLQIMYGESHSDVHVDLACSYPHVASYAHQAYTNMGPHRGNIF